MKDVFGNELKIGDDVVFICGKNSLAEISRGKITKFYKSYFGEDECSVGSHAHILGHRVAKIECLLKRDEKMNLLEHYVEKIYREEDVTEDFKDESWYKPNEKVYLLDMDVVCYGMKQRVQKIFFETEYLSMKQNGYYMA